MKIKLLTLFVLITSVLSVDAQCDYTQLRYAIRSQTDVLYGVQTSWAGRPDSLKIDVYKPVGDNNPKRPVLVLVHGGGFAAGNKSELRSLCEQFASRGYVCVSVGYRLGFVRPLQFDYPFIYDASEIYRALFRGQQDTKGAIRFLKARALTDSTDKEQFYVGGFSAGGFIALAVGYFTDESMKLTSCNAIGNAVNLNGTYQRPNLGLVDGPLNQNGENASVKGVFNFFGAVHDTSIIKSNGPKLFQYHQTGDPVVACGRNKPYHALPLVPDNYPAVSGSCQIKAHLDAMGSSAPEHQHIIHNGNNHDVHDIPGITQQMANTLSKWVCSSIASAESALIMAPRIYPQPSGGTFRIDQLPSSEGILNVRNFNGSIIQSLRIQGNETEIILSQAVPGIYLIEYQSDHNFWHGKLLIE